MLPSTANGIITLLCQPGMESAWRSERRPTSTFEAGFAPLGCDGYSFMSHLPRPWQVVPEWGDWPYQIGWRHNPDRAVLVYCEGDISVETADDLESYVDLLRRTTKEMPASHEDGAAFLARLDKTLENRRATSRANRSESPQVGA